MNVDLLDWNWLYAAGRLQKAVVDVIPPTNLSLCNALKENRKSALGAALLQLPEVFTYEQLFTQIVSLSYNGDFRMRFGEDRNKIKQIVNGTMEKLIDVYAPLIAADSRLKVFKKSVEGSSLLSEQIEQVLLFLIIYFYRIQTRLPYTID